MKKQKGLAGASHSYFNLGYKKAKEDYPEEPRPGQSALRGLKAPRELSKQQQRWWFDGYRAFCCFLRKE